MPFVKGIASIGAAMLIGLSVTPARAGYVVDLTQQGSDVVATGSGPIDLTGLHLVNSDAGISGAELTPSSGLIITGPATFAPHAISVYDGFSGPANFGSGGFTSANSGSGDFVAISDIQGLAVPRGYVSDTALSDTATYNSQTLSSLGVTPGTYEWTWGTGANQNFTLVATVPTVPETSTWTMMLLGFAGLGFMGYQSAGRRGSTDAA